MAHYYYYYYYYYYYCYYYHYRLGCCLERCPRHARSIDVRNCSRSRCN